MCVWNDGMPKLTTPVLMAVNTPWATAPWRCCARRTQEARP